MLHAARLLCAFCSRSRITPAWQARVAWSLLLLSPVSVYGRQSPQLSPFERAQHLREALEARPESQRTQSDYARVLDAYRAVYHRDPTSPKAEASVLAVAQLLGDDGRIFSNEKLLHDAMVNTPSFVCNILTAALASPPKSLTVKSRRVRR
jgi:hypothetical protein